MEFRQLRSAVTIARRLSFTAAAEELALAQPALSQQIAALERELGVRLFERTNRRVALTDAGRAFVARAERVIADLEAAAQEMTAFAGGLRGRDLRRLAVIMHPRFVVQIQDRGECDHQHDAVVRH